MKQRAYRILSCDRGLFVAVVFNLVIWKWKGRIASCTQWENCLRQLSLQTETLRGIASSLPVSCPASFSVKGDGLILQCCPLFTSAAPNHAANFRRADSSVWHHAACARLNTLTHAPSPKLSKVSNWNSLWSVKWGPSPICAIKPVERTFRSCLSVQ